jgi:hypothetical protein
MTHMNARRTATRDARPSSLALLALAGCALTALALGGCDSGSPAGDAVRESAVSVHSIAGGGSTGAPVSWQADALRAAEQSARESADGGAGESASAALMQAQALLGMAEGPLARASEIERDVLNRATVIRAQIEEWTTRQSLASGAESFDPAEQVRAAEARIAELTREAQQIASRKAEIDGRIAELRRQAEEKNSEAQRIADEAAVLRRSVENASAREALPVVERAAQAVRRADTLRAEAATLEADASVLEPQSVEQGVLAQQAASEAESARARIANLREQQARASQEARAQRDAAQQAAQRLDQMLAEARAVRTDNLPGPAQDGLKQADAALAAARKAGNDAGGNATRLLEGDAQHLRGAAFLARAQGLSAWRGLLTDLAGVAPALPNAAQYRAEADEVTQRLSEALSSAREAFEAAQSAYGRAGGRAAGERAERVAGLLGEMAKLAAGEQVDLIATFNLQRRGGASPSAAPEPTPAPSRPQSAAPAGVPQDLVEAINSSFAAAREGRYDDALANVMGPPEVKEALRGQFEASAKFARLDEAMRGRFNTGLFDVAGPMLTPMGMSRKTVTMDLSAADYDITMQDADTAVSRLRGAPQMPPTTYRRVNGVWMLDEGEAGAQLTAAAPMIRRLGEEIDRITADVQSGAIAQAPQVMMRLQQAFMSLMQGGPGGG